MPHQLITNDELIPGLETGAEDRFLLRENDTSDVQSPPPPDSLTTRHSGYVREVRELTACGPHLQSHINARLSRFSFGNRSEIVAKARRPIGHQQILYSRHGDAAAAPPLGPARTPARVSGDKDKRSKTKKTWLSSHPPASLSTRLHRGCRQTARACGDQKNGRAERIEMLQS